MLWNEVEHSPITARDIKSAQALISEALSRRFFKDRFEMASDAEQRYLAAMADLGRRACALGRRSRSARATRSVAARPCCARPAAQGSGLQPATRLPSAFTVPLFAEYVRRPTPLSELRRIATLLLCLSFADANETRREVLTSGLGSSCPRRRDGGT